MLVLVARGPHEATRLAAPILHSWIDVGYMPRLNAIRLLTLNVQMALFRSSGTLTDRSPDASQTAIASMIDIPD